MSVFPRVPGRRVTPRPSERVARITGSTWSCSRPGPRAVRDAIQRRNRVQSRALLLTTWRAAAVCLSRSPRARSNHLGLLFSRPFVVSSERICCSSTTRSRPRKASLGLAVIESAGAIEAWLRVYIMYRKCVCREKEGKSCPTPLLP